HLSDETLTQRKLDSLRGLLEGSIRLCGLQMPNGCWHPLCHTWSHRQIRVAYGPAHIGADTVHGKLQGLRTTRRLIGRNGDVLEQLQEGRTLGDPLFECSIESGQALLTLAQFEVLLVQCAAMLLEELVQTEFINSIGNRPVQQAGREVTLHQIV